MTVRRNFLKAALSAPAALQVGSLYATGNSKGREMTLSESVANVIAAYSAQGDHRTGTEVDELSAQWLVSEIEAMGVAAELDAFDFERLDVIEAALKTDDRSLTGVPLFDCGYTDADGVRGRLGSLGEEGTIGVIKIPASDGGKSATRLHELRTGSAHLAIVVMIESQGSAAGPAVMNAESYRAPYGVPVLQLPYQLETTLQALAERGDELQLVAQTRRAPTRAINVQARIEGADPSAAPLVIMTPRSGWWRCASERGGGIAAFLEMIRAIGRAQPRRSVLFTANTGHELSHLGLDHFLAERPGLIKQAHAWIHLGANFAAANAPVLMQFSDAELKTISQPHLDNFRVKPDQITPLDQRPLGEARNVYDGSGRYVSLLGGNPLFHHPDDIWPSAVDLEKTVAWIGAMTSLALQLSS